MEPDLTEDPLFLACTRPAMFAGVTMEAMALNGMVTMIAFILSSSPFALLGGAVVHGIFSQIIRYDHNAFRILTAWVETRARCRTTSFWGGSTLTPLPLGRTYSDKD
ncbi:MAG: type IV secretion system protein VirB3 [Hyphomicrobiaceae bacterium]|jgi:type IV secretion system protein VirB3